ncbi:hypothetical protein Taro_046918 [Colocasia esculenta]|uniref:Uncharacterized protein n=1 Tax=Colocasia esculenta TaxID=4460 RepID=A0A843WUX3_COLES|nr:hypothetical protein [Colocasia esculenta]
MVHRVHVVSETSVLGTHATPTVVTSPVGCPRFSVSQVVSSGLCPGTCVAPSRFVSSDLDTLTPLLELYVRLRERRQWDSDCCTCLLVTCSVLVVGGTDTSSRHWSPASRSPVPHSSEPRPGSLEVQGMGLRPCGPQFIAIVPVFLVCSVLGEFPTEPMTSEAHPYPHRSVSSDLDTLTPLLELYVRLRERRQWDSDCCTCLLVTCSKLVVGGTDTSSRHWSPASPSPVPHSSEPRPGSLEVPGMGLRPCGQQVVVFSWSPQLLDLFTWSGSWIFRPWLRD